jgi:hypothetical protein
VWGQSQSVSRIAGQAKSVSVIGDRFESKFVDVEGLLIGKVFRWQDRCLKPGRHTVLTKMLASVFRVQGTRQVLRVLNDLSFWIVQYEEQVASSKFRSFRGIQADLEIGVAQRLDVMDFVADVHKADRLRILRAWIELDELVVVDLHEELGGLSAFGEFEGLLEPQAFVELAGLLEIGYAQSDVGNPVEVRGLRRQTWGRPEHKHSCE